MCISHRKSRSIFSKCKVVNFEKFPTVHMCMPCYNKCIEQKLKENKRKVRTKMLICLYYILREASTHIFPLYKSSLLVFITKYILTCFASVFSQISHGPCTNMYCICDFNTIFWIDAEAEAQTMTSAHATLQKSG